MRTLIGNRIEKARRFAEFLTEHAPKYATPEVIALVDETNWTLITALLSKESGRPEGVPSMATRALIVEQLRLNTDTSDPFKGFPS